jgi:type II secretory pathway component PulK
VSTFTHVATTMGPNAMQGISGRIGQQSKYFQLTTRVMLGTTEFTLYSLLYRGTKVAPILRSFGTP